MTPVTLALVLTGVLLNAGAQLLLKAGTRVIGVIGTAHPLRTLATVALQPYIALGLLCYVVSVGIWIVALSRTQVSVAYPMTSLGYVINAFAAWWLFGEAVTPARLLAIGVILLGVILLYKS